MFYFDHSLNFSKKSCLDIHEDYFDYYFEDSLSQTNPLQLLLDLIARLSGDEDVDNEDLEELEDLISTEETVSILNTNL